MSRRADPVRIYTGQRAGMLRRLIDAWRLTESKAEALLVGWEQEAERRRLRRPDPGYWTTGEEWMAGQYRLGR